MKDFKMFEDIGVSDYSQLQEYVDGVAEKNENWKNLSDMGVKVYGEGDNKVKRLKVWVSGTVNIPSSLRLWVLFQSKFTDVLHKKSMQINLREDTLQNSINYLINKFYKSI